MYRHVLYFLQNYSDIIDSIWLHQPHMQYVAPCTFTIYLHQYNNYTTTGKRPWCKGPHLRYCVTYNRECTHISTSTIIYHENLGMYNTNKQKLVNKAHSQEGGRRATVFPRCDFVEAHVHLASG